MATMEKEGTETILLVDDEEFIRTIAKEILESKGYQMIEASQGQEALEIYSTRGTEIDLVILDLAMPIMSGRDAFAKLREQDKNVKVILATGYSKETDLKDLTNLGINGFIEKPYRVDDLAAMIRRVLDED
jgi:two-component system cell cycle sensor histidine kinase/response regulator CckA